ncbi:MAG: succinate dehydrogenase, hydrophobic membrane anchor protein [Betaproteobacteria bacterium]|jgi:succinate dehydrogenase / fumarate reductase membrane anchor subunit|nr:succinate dehydrogenase, hydrophobic membrane anchor protein [Betaproteobacteria bacterium]UOZ96555.1 Succinate dehydrogenase hydrophobic membrane anchor subunit [Cupriavidus sp.]
MSEPRIGQKRLVVGAHYGLRDWLSQRITAVILGSYSVILVVSALLAPEPGYYGWSGLFAQTWMKVFTLLAFLAFFYHAWVGVRDIWMDYVKPLGLRLALQAFTIVWLLGCAIWAIDVLWRV